MTLQRGAGNRHERHDEGIDPERDQRLAGLEDCLLGVAQPGQDIGRHLSAPEHRHGRRKSIEIARDRNLRLARHDARAHLLGHRLEMHPERVDTGIAHAREPSFVVRRLALPLDGQVDGCLHRTRALREDRCAAIAAGGRTGRHHHVLDAVELDRGLRDLGKLTRRLALDRAAGRQRLADGAELAGFGAALVPDTRLQDRGRQHIATMEHRDLPIWDAVRGVEVVEVRPHGEAHITEGDAVTADATATLCVRLFDHIGAFECRRSVHRHHHGDAVDGQRLVVRRAGAAAAAFVADLRINEPHPVGLQLVDQPLGRHRCRRLHGKCSHSMAPEKGWAQQCRSPSAAPAGCRARA